MIISQSKADETSRFSCHEIDDVRSTFFSSDQQITFVFPVFVIHQKDKLALTKVIDDFFDCVERHIVIGRLRVEYGVNEGRLQMSCVALQIQDCGQ